MKALLLIPSTSYRARDFLDAAAALGIDTVVGSDHRQVLAAFSNGRSLHVDLADPRRGVEQIRAHAVRFPVDAVLGTDDASTLLAAAAARGLGLAHNPPDAVLAARDKLRFRQRLAAAGLPGPEFALRDLRDGSFSPDRVPAFPCVAKPRSLAGSRGVIRADDARALDAACARIRRILARCEALPDEAHRHTVLVESYLPGAELAIEGLLDDGRLEVLAVLDKPEPMEGPFFEETLLIAPSRLPASVQREAVHAVRDAARAIGLRHGPVHAELRAGLRGVRVIEVAPRSIGGLCSRALRFRAGASLESLILRHAVGLPLQAHVAAGASGVMMIPVPGAGRLRRVDGRAEALAIPGIEDVTIAVAPGELLVPLPEGDRYTGFLFARGDDPGEVERALRDAHRCLRFTIEERPVA